MFLSDQDLKKYPSVMQEDDDLGIDDDDLDLDDEDLDEDLDIGDDDLDEDWDTEESGDEGEEEL